MYPLLDEKSFLKYTQPFIQERKSFNGLNCSIIILLMFTIVIMENFTIQFIQQLYSNSQCGVLLYIYTIITL